MSMISSLIDELRKLADGQAPYRDARAAMLEAADTIWQLRDDLQRANESVRDAEHDESRAWDRVRKAEAESAKLREQLAKARDPQRIGGTADTESFVYAIEQLREFRWQHATNDEEAIPYINNVADAHERENARLRELVADMLGYYAMPNNIDYKREAALLERARELGAEVEQ